MKKGSQIVYFLREITIVVIGVLIAVSISNYKEKVDNQKYLEKTLLAMENEISLSQNGLDSVLNKHIKLFKTIENQNGENEQTLGELVGNSGGFQIASIKNVSLRFFISNKAELLDFELISQLLEIELQANILSDKIKKLADYAYEYVNGTEEEVKMKFNYLLANVIDGEQTLLKSYSNFLKENKKYLKAGTQ